MRVIAVGWGVWRDTGMAARALGLDRPALAATDAAPRERAGAVPLGDEVPSGSAARRRFEAVYDPRRLWVLNEHRLADGDAVLPGTGFVALARELAHRTVGRGKVEIRDLEFIAPLRFERDLPRRLRIEVARHGRRRGFTVSSAPVRDAADDSAWIEHARGQVLRSPGWTERLPAAGVAAPVAPADDRQRRYMNFGPRWQQAARLSRTGDRLVAHLTIDPAFASDLRTSPLHPATLDLATAAGLRMVPGYDMTDGLFVPIGYGRIRITGALGADVVSHVRLQPGASTDQCSFDVAIADARGRVIVEVQDFTMRRVDPTMLAGSSTASARAALETGPANWIAKGIDTHEGTRLLDRLLTDCPEPEVVVSSLPLEILFAQVDAMRGPGSRQADRGPVAAGDEPSDEVERDLARIWQDLLGVPAVGAGDDFFELGGHSLIAVRLINQVEKRFGTRLKLAHLFEARTIRDLAGLLRGDREASRYVSLAPVQPQGDLPPLYIVHGVGGEVLSYSDLARALGPRQPLFAFRAVGSDGSRPLLETIEEQAAFYVAEMCTHQPAGPYYIAGYSHGGRVAFEMAQQLRRAGRSVAFLGILDTWPCEGLPRAWRYPLDWLRNLPHWLWTDVRLEGWPGIVERLERLRTIVRDQLPGRSGGRDLNAGRGAPSMAHLPEHIQRTFATNFAAFAAYRPSPYDGGLTLFRAKAQPLLSPHSRDLGWGHFARDVRVVDTPGSHGMLLNRPFVDTLAGHIARELELAHGEHAGDAPVEVPTLAADTVWQ